MMLSFVRVSIFPLTTEYRTFLSSMKRFYIKRILIVEEKSSYQAWSKVKNMASIYSINILIQDIFKKTVC